MALNFICTLYLPWVETHGYKIGRADGTGRGIDSRTAVKMLKNYQPPQILSYKFFNPVSDIPAESRPA